MINYFTEAKIGQNELGLIPIFNLKFDRGHPCEP